MRFNMRFVIVIFFLFISSPMTVNAQDSSTSLDDFDFSDIQQVIDDTLSGTDLQFKDLVKMLMNGKTKEFQKNIGVFIKNAIFSEVKANKGAIIQVMIISAIGALFSNFTSVFKNNQIAEVGFYITYLLLITLLAGSFTMAVSIATGMLSNLISFMKALVPAYFLAVAFVTGSAATLAYYEFALILITVVEWLLAHIIIPLIQIYVIIMFVNNLTKEDFLSKLAELIQTGAEWGLKTILGFVIGVQLIQSIILPFISGSGAVVVQKAIQAIPGIGGSASAISDLLLGSGVLIKNGIGAAALIIIALLSIIPMLKLVIIVFLYHLAAAALQPLADSRTIECVSSVALGGKLLLRTITIAALLFFITIAVICSSTNVTFFAS